MSERRHEPTPTKLRKAAREGQSAYSHDLATGVSLLSAVGAVALLAAPLLQSLMQLATRQWSAAGKRTDVLLVDQAVLGRIAVQTIPILAVILFVSWLAGCGQRGWRWIPWKWRADRLSPGQNLRSLASNLDVALAGGVKAALFVTLAGSCCSSAVIKSESINFP